MQTMNEPWTPGPWANLGPTEFRGDLIVGDSRPAPEGMDAADGQIHTAVAEVLADAAGFEGNARLIAAAPEMAELLAETLADFDQESTGVQVSGGNAPQIRALLARIRGA